MKHACVNCGGARKRAFWHNEKHLHLLARCLDCGANFNGSGYWLPKEGSNRGVLLDVDPHAGHRHGHGPCDGGNQTLNLFGDA